jgi:CPA1 family monovalent cation:H+ antiporter
MPLSETVLLAAGLLTIAMVAAGLCRNLPIPFTVLLVIIGIALGSAARSWPQFQPLLHFQLNPELVLFLFLPALIFESAFNLEARQMVKDLGPILALSIPALLISALLVGTGLWLVLDIGFLLALLFGALISATDPVAVIALFRELGAPRRLTIIVEGESLFNDATAIVLFHIVLGLLAAGAVTVADAGIAAGEFVRVFLGGALAGAIIGYAVSELLYRLSLGLSSALVMSLVVAYGGFSVAEHVLHVSGVMAVVAGAITFNMFGIGRIPQPATRLVAETWEVIALVCNSMLFLLVGLSVDVVQLLARFDIILLATVIVLIARAAAVYSLVPAATRLFELPPVGMGERHIMWWGGLKGGLAIAIVLSIPTEVEGRGLLLDLTLGVVLASLLVNAPTIRPLIRFLGIDRLTDEERAELRHGLVAARNHAWEILHGMQGAGLVSRNTSRQVRLRTEQLFEEAAPAQDRRQDRRHLAITALRLELDELRRLYGIGLIQHYIYLDMLNNLQRDREAWLSEQQKQIVPTETGGLFLRLEKAVLRRLREHDWAAGILARYQYLRFSQSLQRDMAGVLTSSAVLEALEREHEHETALREQLSAIYRERLSRRKARLLRVAAEFPDFYRRFEMQLSMKVALTAALHSTEQANQHGELSTKVLTRIERRIHDALAVLPPISSPAPALRPGELISAVPLLNGISPELLERLAALAQPVTFLAGDVVIGEGEHGDALYIIMHGMVDVYRTDAADTAVAELRDGDFFGEVALFGDHVRTATVKAVTPSTLLRLRRRDILALADAEPELRNCLIEARDERSRPDKETGAGS